MKRKPRSEHPLLHTVEEATELLRNCEVRAWVWWFAGSAPFAIGLLHFTSDMSRAATAEQRLPGSALVLALLYWWMKVAQAVFSDHLLRQLRGDDEPPPLTQRGRLRLITSQALIHGTMPWVLPLALAAMLPLGWAYAAYHNVTVLALSVFRQGGRTRDLIRTALLQSNYRQRQNHGLMMILLVFAGIVWLNCHGGVMFVAYLTSVFTGAENALTRNPMMLLSTGIITATLTASYLVVGPFVKALYVLRCFYSLSRKNGEDLAVAFRQSAIPVVAMLCFIAGTQCRAVAAQPRSECGGEDTALNVRPTAEAVHQPPSEATDHRSTHLPLSSPSPIVTSRAASSPPHSKGVDPHALDQHIQTVLQKDIFQWRMPREHTKAKAERSWLESFIDDCGKWTKKAMDSMGEAIDRLMTDKIKEWIKGVMGKKMTMSDSAASTPWADSVQLLLKGLLIVLGLALAALLIRQWRNLPPPTSKGEAAVPDVNLESDQIVATQLPENEWLRMAEEKINAGEFRLAMRALFLATLAHLGDRKLLAIRKSKSNGDYVRELALRARDRLDLRGSFTDSVRVFDWAWYGWHDVTRELLEQFRANHQRITTDGRPL